MPEALATSDEFVSIPVPRRFLPLIYRTLAEATAAEAANAVPIESFTGRHNLIDLIGRVAREIGADRHAVSLPELHTAYVQRYPGVGKGGSRASFDATIAYHCINMRSRFPDPKDRRKAAYWLSHPVFKRIERAQYMLLSLEEIERFQRCVAAGDSMVYADDYDVAGLPECSTNEVQS